MKSNTKHWRHLTAIVGIVLGVIVSARAALAQASLPNNTAFLSVGAETQKYRYRYVSFSQVELPSGFFSFGPWAINNSGRIYGTVYDDSDMPHVAVYAHGAVTILQPGVVSAVNAGGTIGGYVVLNPDPNNFMTQAALFRRDKVELIPPQPGEVFASVFALNDLGTALVESYDASFEQPTYVLYKHGQATPLDFGPTVTDPFFLAINNQGIISGTQGSSCNGATGFRFDTRTGAATLLDPLSTEPDAWGLDINNRGAVLGYSFVCSGIERIGVWDRHGKFKTYFVEGIPEFPTISNRLLFNDNNLIVITRVSSPDSERLKNSYLVPKPGIRLNLADLVKNLPVGLNLSYIQAINNHGDMIGFDFFGGDAFLLQRIGGGGH